MILEDIKKDCPILYKIGQFYSISDGLELYRFLQSELNPNKEFSTGMQYYKRSKLRVETNKLSSLLAIEKFKK